VVNLFRTSQAGGGPFAGAQMQMDAAAAGRRAGPPAPGESPPCIEVADLVVRYGETVAVNGVSFTVPRGEHLTLLGPSGCGKTTTLRAIAGLEPPERGSIRIDGKLVHSKADGIDVPAEKRGISMVFQSYAVWPHMSVFENVAYGLRVRRLDPATVTEKVEWALDLVHMQGYGPRSAAKLSGGQQQRVALARAIAFSPTVVLFDEPLSNLDAKLRAEMRVELRELQQRLGVSSVYVTHDQEEALAISDRVVVMNEGRIVQIGTPEEIYNRPRSRFVADFVGSANLIDGRVRAASGEPGPVEFEMARGVLLRGYALHAPRGDETQVAVRTAYITLAHPGVMSGGNSVPGCIHRRLFHGDFVQYIVDWPAGQLVIRRPPTDVFKEGAAVVVAFAPEHCILLEA
jgi:iron(III) transport system ATP-binding protein